MRRSITTILILLLISACVPKAGKNTRGKTTSDPVTGVDPLASYAWHLSNTGQSSFSTSAGTTGQDFSIKQALALGYTGSGIKIAVSDTGVEVNHSDLTNNQTSKSLHRNYNSNYSSAWHGGDPFPIEYEAHGTAVAGLISAVADNAIGSKGVAPKSKFAGFLFIGDFNDTVSSYEAKTLDQMTGDFDIFNYSYGYSGCEFAPTTASIVNAYKTGVTNLRNGKGAVYVKAAGNDFVGYNSECDADDDTYYFGNTNTSEDQNIPYIILTTAVNAQGKISSYSTPGSGLWVSSAGGEYGTSSPAMITTDIRGCQEGYSTSASYVSDFNRGKSSLNENCDYTSIMNGTSSAAPVLSGIIALMLEANPNLTWRDVKHILATTADRINYSTLALPHPYEAGLAGHVYDYIYVPNAAGFYFSNTYGFGRVNALAAVTKAKTYTNELGTYQETSYIESGSLSLPIPDNSATGVESTLTSTYGLIIESIQIKISTNHTYVGDLGVELTSPSGTTSKLLLINSNIYQNGLNDFTLLTNAFYGENSYGTWTIKLIDGAQDDAGSLTSWKLKINGH
jgi:subtilisin-like proprotein convertase family protein